MNNEKPFILVGLTGPAGVGKSTIAEGMKFFANFKTLSYAYPLKQALIKMTGLSEKWFYDSDFKENEIPDLGGITTRVLMQKFGTEFAREMIHPDFWIWKMRTTIIVRKHRTIRRPLIIDDIRFDNEANLVRRLGGIVVHLKRDFKTRTSHTDHKSEKGIIFHKSDFTLTCDCDERRSMKLLDSIIRDVYGEYN